MSVIRKVGGDMGLGEARDLIEAADRQFDLSLIQVKILFCTVHYQE